MSTFKLTVSSPDGNVFSGKVQRITLRGAEGDLAVLAGHTPFVTSVKAGQCRVVLERGEERTGLTDGGLLTVGGHEVTLLSGSFRWKD